MHRTPAIVAALALAALWSNAGAEPVLAFHGVPQPPLVHPDHRVLYEQTGNDSGIAIVSQSFEGGGNEAYDAVSADDFVLPNGATGWVVTEVDVVGQYFSGAGPADSVNVNFFNDSRSGVYPHMPGHIIRRYKDQVPNDNGTGSFNIVLDPVVPRLILKPGVRYWLSVQANMAFASGGEWGWENQTMQVANPVLWRNPGNGFGTGCTTFTVESTCVGSLGQADSKIFVLKGYALKGAAR